MRKKERSDGCYYYYSTTYSTWLSWSMVMWVFHGSRKKRWYFSSVRVLPGISVAGRRLPSARFSFDSPIRSSSSPFFAWCLPSLRSTELQIPSSCKKQEKATVAEDAALKASVGGRPVSPNKLFYWTVRNSRIVGTEMQEGNRACLGVRVCSRLQSRFNNSCALCAKPGRGRPVLEASLCCVSSSARPVP